ncbi:MAG: transposase [Methylococcales bacterium]
MIKKPSHAPTNTLIPAPQKATIQRVCEGYSNAVYETLPNVIVIVDQFHVAKNYRACADKAKKAAMHALKKTLSDQDTAELKAFRKRWQDLTM